MIIIKPAKKIKSLNQNSYDNIIFSFDFSQIHCPDCDSHDWYVHAYYLKSFYLFGSIKIKILRIRCVHCGKTHAVFVESMIPYLSLTFDTIISIVEKDILVYSSLYYFIVRKLTSSHIPYECFCLSNSRNHHCLFFST